MSGALALAFAGTAAHALPSLPPRPAAGATAATVECAAVAAAQDQEEAEAERDAVEALLEEGRTHLRAREIDRALEVLERAVELDGGAFRSRLWLLRAWIAAGRINDALDEIDVLAREHAGPAIDYLYGMAFAYKAQGYLAQGVTDASVGMHFQDAAAHLARATEADPERFGDAFLALALASWYASPPELERAREAIEASLARWPDDANAWFQKGRIAFSQYRAAAPDESRAAESEAHWRAAFEAFGRAAEGPVEGDGAAADDARAEERRLLVARSHLQRAHLLLWKQRGEEAAAELAGVLAVDPAGLDYAQALDQLGERHFLRALELGAEAFAAAHPERDVDPTLAWWLGYARIRTGDLEGAEAAFLESVALEPSFSNAWYWIAKARYAREDWTGAAAALVSHYEAHPAGLLASLQAQPAENLSLLRWLQRTSERAGDLVGASVAAEMGAELALDDAALWGDTGRLLRLRRAALAAAGDDPGGAGALAERSLAAYRRALALEPDDPARLLDVAAVLHRDVARELDEAARLYRRAAERAEELARDAAAPAERRARWERLAREARAALAELEGRAPVLPARRGA